MTQTILKTIEKQTKTAEGGLDKRPYVLRLTSAMGGLDLDFAGPAKLPRGLDSVPPAAR